MSNEPQTVAGQRLDLDWPGAFIDRLAWRQRILAIEREARSGLDAGLLADVIDHIGGLNALLAAYRVGSGRSPEKALATLDRTDDVPSRLRAALASSGEAAPVDGLRDELRALVAERAGEDPWYEPDLGTGTEWPPEECAFCGHIKPGHTDDCWWVRARAALAREEADDDR